MPLQATSGAASYDAFGGGVPAVPKYIEDYFSTYLVTGDGTAPAVNNGIDLSTKGGLVWTKKRSAAGSHSLFDTARGANLRLISNDTAAQDSVNLSFTTTGFSNYTFDSGVTYTSWSWAKAPKFFDIVTWTGDDVVGRQIPHNLGSVPGCILVKRLSNGSWNWVVYHRSLGNTMFLNLNNDALASAQTYWNNTTPTSTVFTVGDWNNVNRSPETYVAYLFAHNAGGFGLTGTDNVISCGSFTGNTTVNLGYEPQWIMLKRVDNIGSWDMHDVMRGWPVSGDAARLRANLSDAEGQTSQIYPNATGFSTLIGSGDYIYIAIRRGPMKVPTDATKVFAPIAYAGNDVANRVITGLINTPDWVLYSSRNAAGQGNHFVGSRLQGGGKYLLTESTSAESSSTSYGIQTYGQTSVTLGSAITNEQNAIGIDYILYGIGRAPSFFDEVCYTGTGSQQNLTHNLGVAPELLIVKRRSAAGTSWATWVTSLTADQSLALNTTDDKTAVFSVGFWGSTFPTASVFTVGSNVNTNSNAQTYVAYLFATCAGVSKCFSYTGNGSSQTINCGFTGGARWILIKRTDSTGDWYVWDSARGIVSGNDPHLSLNTTAAEVTSDDTIDTDSTGFVVNQVSATNVNVSSATYIGIAIA